MEEFRCEPDCSGKRGGTFPWPRRPRHFTPQQHQRTCTSSATIAFPMVVLQMVCRIQSDCRGYEKSLLEYTYSPHLQPATMPNIPTDMYEPTTPTSLIICPLTLLTQAQSLSETFWPFSVTYHNVSSSALNVIKRLRSSSQLGRSEGNKVRRISKSKDAPSSIRQPTSQKEVEETVMSNQEPLHDGLAVFPRTFFFVCRNIYS